MKSKLLLISLLFSLFLSSCVNKKEEVNKEIKQGVKVLYIGNFSEAIKHFERALELDSTNAEAYLYLSRTYSNQRKYDKAMAAINQAIHYNPNYGEAYRSRGLLWKALGDNDNFCKDYIKAEDLGVKNLNNYTSKCRNAHLYK